jgi:hypothetical protein
MIYFRSILIGLAAMFATVFLEIVGTVWWAFHSMPRESLPPGTDIGVDLFSLYRNSPHKALYLVLALAAFAVGCFLGNRTFFRS